MVVPGTIRGAIPRRVRVAVRIGIVRTRVHGVPIEREAENDTVMESVAMVQDVVIFPEVRVMKRPGKVPGVPSEVAAPISREVSTTVESADMAAAEVPSLEAAVTSTAVPAAHPCESRSAGERQGEERREANGREAHPRPAQRPMLRREHHGVTVGAP